VVSFVSKQRVDAAAVEEADEVGFVFRGPSAAREAGAQLDENDERHEDLVRSMEPFHRFGKALREIDIAVCVDRDSHRQSASSTRS
jgi:hypothetical protein